MPAEYVSPGAVIRHELHALQQQWWCFLLLGISLIIIGSICIAEPLIGSIASVLFLGFLLLAAGITQVISSFWAGRWSGMVEDPAAGGARTMSGKMSSEGGAS